MGPKTRKRQTKAKLDQKNRACVLILFYFFANARVYFKPPNHKYHKGNFELKRRIVSRQILSNPLEVPLFQQISLSQGLKRAQRSQLLLLGIQSAPPNLSRRAQMFQMFLHSRRGVKISPNQGGDNHRTSVKF